MTDKESVIEGLEHCKKSHCYRCPYVCDGLCGANCTADLASDVLDLLKEQKEQEAVPVIQREVMHMLFWCCSSCGVAITDGDKFCRNCGKELKWE